MNYLKDRREKKDFWSISLVILNVLASILLIVILLVFHRAQPEFETVFDRFYQLKLRTFWDLRYLDLLIYFVMSGICVSIIGLILSLYRGRRKSDHSIALIIMGILSFILLLVSLYKL